MAVTGASGCDVSSAFRGELRSGPRSSIRPLPLGAGVPIGMALSIQQSRRQMSPVDQGAELILQIVHGPARYVGSLVKVNWQAPTAAFVVKDELLQT